MNLSLIYICIIFQVDIVFEMEDESFYSALTTLIQTSKRPIVLTLGSTEERVLTQIQDKIKSYFDIFYFLSPDQSIACKFSICIYTWNGFLCFDCHFLTQAAICGVCV